MHFFFLNSYVKKVSWLKQETWSWSSRRENSEIGMRRATGAHLGLGREEDDDHR